ncbi:MAG: response regulator [Myxococcota bacterium]
MRAEQPRVRILVVEDDRTSRENLAELLEGEGPYEVSVAPDGAAALNMLQGTTPFDIVITDIKMPGADGVEVLRRAKTRREETAVIVLTGYGSLETATAAVRAGAFAYLLKPIDFDNLVALVGEAAAKVRLVRENRDLTERLAAANEELTRGIQQQLEANQRLRRAQSALAEHEKMRALGQLVAGIAHELRNPLTGIIGLTEAIIRDGSLNATDAEDLGAVKDLGLRCRDIIENLLRFARGEKLVKGGVPVRSIVDDVLKLVEHEARHSTIAMEVDVPVGVPNLFANRNQIGQVLLNLVRNAMEALNESESAVKKITVTAARVEDRIRIIVADTGPGIEDPSRLFEPFFTTKEPGKGTGLGLALSRGIVEEHGGHISAENSPGGGARFTVELPFEGGSDLNEVPHIRPLGESSRSRHVLLVDDETSIHQVINRLLRNRSVVIESFLTAGEARAFLERADSSFDIVLTDLRMPGEFDGYALVQWIFDHRPELARRLVVMTGDQVPPETMAQFSRYQIKVLTKPFDPDDLLAAIFRDSLEPSESARA